MANNWNIPAWLEKEVRERDKQCVYCGAEFTPAKGKNNSQFGYKHHTVKNVALILKRLLQSSKEAIANGL